MKGKAVERRRKKGGNDDRKKVKKSDKGTKFAALDKEEKKGSEWKSPMRRLEEGSEGVEGSRRW